MNYVLYTLIGIILMYCCVMTFTSSQHFTLEYHDILNPMIWTPNYTMIQSVHDKIMEICNSYITFIQLPREYITDIVCKGSNANYTYTKYSDIDIHIQFDVEKISCDTNLVSKYFIMCSKLWSTKYSSIKVKGCNVEIIATDDQEHHHSSDGVYSLLSNVWIQKPINNQIKDIDGKIINETESYLKTLDTLFLNPEKNIEQINTLIKTLKNLRSNPPDNNFEYNKYNIIFKDLRNKGYIKKLNEYKQIVKTSKLSLK